MGSKTWMDTETARESIEARVPGQGSFIVTGGAARIIEVFGGLLHCYQGAGGCRKQGLYFSRTEPRKYLRCELAAASSPEDAGAGGTDQAGWENVAISVSHELAPKLDGAVLDFGTYNKMQRFVWLAMPAVKGPSCACLRSLGAPAGKRSPCLDDQGLGLADL